MLRLKTLTIFLIISLLIAFPLVYYGFFVQEPSQDETLDVFLGIDVAYADLGAIKSLIDEVSSYTNLFVIGSLAITEGCSVIADNSTILDETCQYIYDKGLSFIVYTMLYPTSQWLEDAKNRWGDRLLGFYANDEYGGSQLDGVRGHPEMRWVSEADDYTDAANEFVDELNRSLNFVTSEYGSVYYPLFTSDYALYWFDYKAGYDVVLAHFGWNNSRQLNVALCRGAATVQNKDWGAMITWTYYNPPYIESGEELYNDMVLAYNNGAKYVVVFDANKDHTQGILEEEHLEALRRFWQYVQDNPRTDDAINDRVAYVLPKDFGYGFRGLDDKIWGLWEADAFSYELCMNIDSLMEQYGTKLDIIYDDGLEFGNAYGYNKLIFWNGTVYIP